MLIRGPGSPVHRQQQRGVLAGPPRTGRLVVNCGVKSSARPSAGEALRSGARRSVLVVAQTRRYAPAAVGNARSHWLTNSPTADTTEQIHCLVRLGRGGTQGMRGSERHVSRRPIAPDAPPQPSPARWHPERAREGDGARRRQGGARTYSALFRGRNNADCPTLRLFRPEGRPAWSATGFAGTRSEQSGSSADAAAHHVGVNDRAHDQAEHNRMQLLSLMLIGFVGCPRRVRSIDRATALPLPACGTVLALLDGPGLFRPSRVGCPCQAGRTTLTSEQSRGRNNRRSAHLDLPGFTLKSRHNSGP